MQFKCWIVFQHLEVDNRVIYHTVPILPYFQHFLVAHISPMKVIMEVTLLWWSARQALGGSSFLGEHPRGISSCYLSFRAALASAWNAFWAINNLLVNKAIHLIKLTFCDNFREVLFVMTHVHYAVQIDLWLFGPSGWMISTAQWWNCTISW